MSETKLEDVKEAAGKAREAVGGDDDGGVAKRILVPAAAGVGTLAATYAARKAPDLLRDKLLPKLEQEGGQAASEMGKRALSGLGGGGALGKAAGKAAEKVGGGGGDGGRSGKTRRLPIQRWTDVGVPVETAYEKWTEFDGFPEFMHRALNVEEEDGRISWREKIWFSTREWEGEIVERRKNHRIAWKTTEGVAHAGVVSFHAIGDDLTRVMVTMDFRPTGMVEKMASGLRFVKRAVQSDLARFKAYVEMGDVEGLDYASRAGGDEGGDEEQEQRASSGSSGSNGRPREVDEDARRERAERRERRRS